MFQGEAGYTGNLDTVGELASGYLYQTVALRTVNNKLLTICIAAKRCEDPRED